MPSSAVHPPDSHSFPTRRSSDLLGDAERAGIGDATGGLVRVDAGHLAVRRAVVVRAGEDVEEAGRVLRRLSGGVERSVVGDDVDPDRKSTRLNSSHLGISYAVFCCPPPRFTLFPYTTLFRSPR